MKKIFLIFLIATIGHLSSADDYYLSELSNSTPVLTKISSNSPPTEGLNKLYLKAAQDYEQHPEHYTTDQLFGVARGYVIEGKYKQAIPLYIKSLTVQPTNTVAIRELAICYLKIQKFDEATSQFKRGWMLGDDVALKDWANVYFILGHFADIKPLVPDLLKTRDRISGSEKKHEVINDLIAYSLNAKPSADKGVFLKTIDGLSDEFILEREDTTKFVILGLKTFGYQEKADKLSAEMKKVN
jgi:tetratricopeptide (TPR) repeat protein